MNSNITKLFLVLITLSGFSQNYAQQNGVGIDLSLMDTSLSPKDNFFNFVNGTWLKNTEIPADRPRWGSFDELRKRTDFDALAILEEAAKDEKYTSDTDQGKAINLYKSIMDTVSRNKVAVTPLNPYIKKINAVKSIAELQKLMIEMAPKGGIGFFGIGVGTDAKNSSRNVVYVSPGALGLPDRDYYISDDADSKEKREKYVLHVSRMLQYLGEKPAVALKNAQKILALETAMSKPRLDRVERRDRRKSYNPMTIGELQNITNAINWEAQVVGIGLPKVDTLIVIATKIHAGTSKHFY